MTSDWSGSVTLRGDPVRTGWGRGQISYSQQPRGQTSVGVLVVIKGTLWGVVLRLPGSNTAGCHSQPG